MLREPFRVVFDALLKTRGIGAGAMPATLHLSQLVAEFSLRGPVAFERRVEVQALCKSALMLGLQSADARLPAG